MDRFHSQFGFVLNSGNICRIYGGHSIFGDWHYQFYGASKYSHLIWMSEVNRINASFAKCESYLFYLQINSQKNLLVTK